MTPKEYSLGEQRKGIVVCRSIKVLRGGTTAVTAEEIRAAALQFVRKISGYRAPSRVNEEPFESAIEEITRASAKLLSSLRSPTH